MKNDRWVDYNPNPKRAIVGDCVIRALTKALNSDWETVYANLTAYGFAFGDLPNSNRVWGRFLKEKGFIRYNFDMDITVNEFCELNQAGIFVLGLDSHVVCVENGKIYDTWDCGDEYLYCFWVKER